jgi:hypothetical protein
MPSAKNPYKQGTYTPMSTKYRGKHQPIYRSGLELTFFRWCDRNDKVLSWGSEAVVVPYLSPKDGKIHRYFVDGVIHLQTNEGIKKYLIEIKPKSQTMPPKPSNKKKRSTILYEQLAWAVNTSKWTSAKKWCDANGYVFSVLTEKDIQ